MDFEPRDKDIGARPGQRHPTQGAITPGRPGQMGRWPGAAAPRAFLSRGSGCSLLSLLPSSGLGWGRGAELGGTGGHRATPVTQHVPELGKGCRTKQRQAGLGCRVCSQENCRGLQKVSLVLGEGHRMGTTGQGSWESPCLVPGPGVGSSD